MSGLYVSSLGPRRAGPPDSGAEDVILIDMAVAAGVPFKVFSLDTGRLHPETNQFIKVRTTTASGSKRSILGRCRAGPHSREGFVLVLRRWPQGVLRGTQGGAADAALAPLRAWM